MIFHIKDLQHGCQAPMLQKSFARYEKQIDANGETLLYTKTTYAPNGNIVHVAPKFPIGPKIYPNLELAPEPRMKI